MAELKRKFTDLNQRTPEVTAKMIDTYARPFMGGVSQLEMIGSALTDINPKIQQYLTKQQNEAEQTEILAGMEAYRRYISDNGKDFTKSDVKEMIDFMAQDPKEGAKHFTNLMRRGAIEARGQMIAGAMQDFGLTFPTHGMVKDENGNDVMLMSIKDPVKRQAAFQKAMQEQLNSMTGGTYDPRIYKQYIQPAISQAQNQFAQASAYQLNKDLMTERKDALTAQFMQVMKPIVSEKLLISDTNGVATNNFIATIGRYYEQLRGADNSGVGMSKTDALAAVSQTLENIAVDPNIDTQTKDRIYKMLDKIPVIAGNAQILERCNVAFSNGIFQQRRRMEADREEYTQECIANIEDNVVDLLKNGASEEQISNNVWSFISTLNKDRLGSNRARLTEVLRDTLALRKLIDENTLKGNSMNATDFANLLSDLQTGRATLGTLRQFAGNMDLDQFKDCASVLSANKTLAKASGQSTGAYTKGLKTRFNSIEKRVQAALGLKDNESKLNPAVPQIANIAFAYVQAEMTANPEKYKNNFAAQQILEIESVEKAKDKLNKLLGSENAVQQITRNPKLLEQKPEEIKKTIRQNDVNAFKSRFRNFDGDKKLQSIILTGIQKGVKGLSESDKKTLSQAAGKGKSAFIGSTRATDEELEAILSPGRKLFETGKK